MNLTNLRLIFTNHESIQYVETRKERWDILCREIIYCHGQGWVDWPAGHVWYASISWYILFYCVYKIYMDSVVTAVIVIRSRAMSYLTRQKGHSDRRLPKLTARYQLTLRLTIDSSSLPKQCLLCNASMHVCILGTIFY